MEGKGTKTDACHGRMGALFHALNAHPGWDNKTTAPSLKAVINLHRGPTELHFWADATPAVTPVTGAKLFSPSNAMRSYCDALRWAMSNSLSALL